MSEPEQQSGEVAPPLHLVVVGAGLAGLAAAITTRLEGHHVTVLERVSSLQPVGAGLQMTPNATRLLKHWDIFDALGPLAAVPSSLSVRRYDGRCLLAEERRFQDKMEERYGAPFWDVHRADLQNIMAARATRLGVDIVLSAHVVDLDIPEAAAVLVDGQKVKGDVLLAADGLWSTCRTRLLGRSEPPQPTGDLVYRIILNLEDIEDSELRDWVSKPTVNFWVGPGSHAVGYSVRAGQQFNLVLAIPDDLPEDVSRSVGNIAEMRELFRNWDPMFLGQVKSVDKWKLMHQTELETWRSKTGTFVMAGDSCHPMLPYLAQGANSALEDGAVLGRLLGHAKCPSRIDEATKLYQELRKARGESIARETLAQRASFHMKDGDSQEHRDAIFLACLGSEPTPHFPSRWCVPNADLCSTLTMCIRTCPVVQPWLYGYDAIAEADRAWAGRKGIALDGTISDLK